VLASVIEPKNDVLPLIANHFCDRLRGEAFLIYDETHRKALVNRQSGAVLVPLDDFALPAPGKEETAYRRLWKQFYETIAIEGRNNPRCRMSFMPKRYWRNLTEFFPDEAFCPDDPALGSSGGGEQLPTWI
jgi:probable DNA metabolism protein